MARRRPRKKKRISYTAIFVGFALAIALILLMAGAAWYFYRPAPPSKKPSEIDPRKIAKTLARVAEARLSLPPLDDQGMLLNSGKRTDSTGEVYFIEWAGSSDTGLVLAEKAVEDAWRELGPHVRVGIVYPQHPRAGERVLMVAGVSEKPLVELKLKLDKKLAIPAQPKTPTRTKPVTKPGPVTRPRTGKIAIIIDDIGNSIEVVQSLLSLPAPITFSVLPNAEQTAAVCDLLRRRKAEIMLHMPMEPLSYPDADPGPGALLLGMNAKEIRNSLKKALRAVPGARGVNNHMGSAYTSDTAAMSAFMKEVRNQDLYFIDSRTTTQTVGFILAREMGVPAAERRVFLDHTRDVAEIRARLELLGETAETEGVAVGIGHPYPETIQVLSEMVPEMAGQGYSFVAASEAVQ